MAVVEGPPKDAGNVVGETPFVRPKFTPVQDIIDGIKYVMWNPNANVITMPLFLVIESMAMKYIQARVSYTEIDYTAYMEQIWMIQNGERDYSKIEGGTGPLVYPAGHVWVYKAMEQISDGLENISAAQDVFRYLYLLTLLVQFIVYSQLNVPPAFVAFALLSKRLHSIYVLRLFNDCFTTLMVSVSILFYVLATKQQKYRAFVTVIGSIFYSMAVSVKMNALLYLPGVLLTVYLINKGNLAKSVLNLAMMLLWQICVALPFVREYPNEYLHSAFNFGRQFMHKWSVNWQMLEEEAFMDTRFHQVLLASQLVVLLLFLVNRMLPFPASELFSVVINSVAHPLTDSIQQHVSATQVAYILIVCNYTGVLFARSLHYQFLSWYHWTIPLLLFWSRVPYFFILPWYLLHEWCWNSYPPNAAASTVLHLCNTVLLIATFLTPVVTDHPPPAKTKQE